MAVVFKIATVLVIIGGINWGLIGFFDYNLVAVIFGSGSVAEKIVYCAVGVSALLAIGVLVPRRSRS